MRQVSTSLPSATANAAANTGSVVITMAARVATRSNAGEWWPIAELDAAGLPTLFARAAQLAVEEAA